MSSQFVPQQYTPPESAFAPPAKPAEPIEVGTAHQLFMDDFLIAQKSSIHRRLNQPMKERTPFLKADKPWEGGGLVFGCIVQVGDTWRLYYKSLVPNTMNSPEYIQERGYGKYLVCMAQSKDGVHFEKINLPNAAVPNTNVVMDVSMDDFCIVHDLEESNPQYRFKMLASVDNWFEGLSSATSPDGIVWTMQQKFTVTKLGDRMSYWWDPINRKHIAWSRNYAIMGDRIIVQANTPDFFNWQDRVESHPRILLQARTPDHPETEIYGGYGFYYHSLYIAYLEMYYKHEQRIDTQLACSRDGKSWHRMCVNDQFIASDAGGKVVNQYKRVQNHEIFIPNGSHGEFDAYWVVPTFNAPILKDGKLLIHYEGRSAPHAAHSFGAISKIMPAAMAMATLREDGFVSLDATGLVGTVTTHVLKLPADTQGMDVNVCPFNTQAQYDPMEVGVDIMDHEGGQIIDSFQLIGNPDPQITWHGLKATKPWPELVKIRFRLRNARLYSFRMRT